MYVDIVNYSKTIVIHSKLQYTTFYYALYDFIWRSYNYRFHGNYNILLYYNKIWWNYLDILCKQLNNETAYKAIQTDFVNTQQ